MFSKTIYVMIDMTLFTMKGRNMAANTSLLILHIFEEYSDRRNPLSKKDIINLLNDEFGVVISDKQFYRKIKELENTYFNIVKTRGKYAKYYLDKNTLDSYELLFIYSLLKANPYISKGETSKLIEGIDNLSPVTNRMNDFHRKCLKNIDTDKDIIDNIKKFRVIVDSIKNNQSIRFKILNKSEINEVTFSDYLFMWPKSYNVIEGNFLINGKDVSNNKIVIAINKMFNIEIKDF